MAWETAVTAKWHDSVEVGPKAVTTYSFAVLVFLWCIPLLFPGLGASVIVEPPRFLALGSIVVPEIERHCGFLLLPTHTNRVKDRRRSILVHRGWHSIGRRVRLFALCGRRVRSTGGGSGLRDGYNGGRGRVLLRMRWSTWTVATGRANGRDSLASLDDGLFHRYRARHAV